MKTHTDEARAEVRAARKSMCDRLGNDPHRLLAHLRAEQKNYQGRIIKNWFETQNTTDLRETPPTKKRGQ